MNAEIDKALPRRRLLHELTRLSKRVRLRRGGIMLAGSRRPWYRVADPDAVVESAAVADRDPFWAQDWPSALAFDRCFPFWTSLCPPDALGAEILELGCGSGATTAALRLRGLRCLATDAEPQAVQLARINQLANGLSPKAERLEWSDPCGRRRYSLIVAADIVYARGSFAPLLDCLSRHLAPGGTAVIAEPGRTTGDEFCGRLAAAGWEVQQARPPQNEGPAIRFIICRPPAG